MSLLTAWYIRRLKNGNLSVREKALHAIQTRNDARAQGVAKLWNSLLESIPEKTKSGKFGVYKDKQSFALYWLKWAVKWLEEGYGFEVIYQEEQGHISNEPELLRREIDKLKKKLDATPRVIVRDIAIYEDTGEIDISYIGSGGPSCGGGTVQVFVGDERREVPNPLACELERKIASAQRKLDKLDPWIVDMPEHLEVVRGRALKK